MRRLLTFIILALIPAALLAQEYVTPDSLEVASIGRSLAENISESILKLGLDDTFTERTASHIISVIESAGLIHDIGNPPFGHFGEESIREWFGRHLPRLCRT